MVFIKSLKERLNIMADEVNTSKVTPVEAKKETTEKKAARGRKKASLKTKAATNNTIEKTVEKNKATKTNKPVPELNYKSLTIEFNDKKYSQKDLYDRVQTYIKKHPYIVAHDIEIFIKPEDSCAYFTVDGFSNPDFKIDL